MTSSLRDLLNAVREGKLEPADAAAMLDRGETTAADTSPVDTTPVDTSPPEASPVDTSPVESEPVEGSPAAVDEADAQSVDDTDSDRAAGTGAADPNATAGAWADAVDDPAALPAPRGASAAAASVDAPRTAGSPDAVRSLEVEPIATVSLRLRAMTRRVRVLADPTVATVSVDGPHELRREGGTLILESDHDLPFGDPFAFLPSMRGGFRLQPSRGFPLAFGSDLVVRLNPAIALDVDVTAGSLLVRGVPRVRARVTAGSARIEEMDGPLDLHVVGGTAKVDLTARGSENRIRCESGSISLRLRRDSDVRLRPDAQLGRIVIDGVEGGREIAVGAGRGRLDVEIVMGNLQVEVER